jgi:hypothetical protein
MALNVGELFATIDLRDKLSAGLRRAMNNMRDSASGFGSQADSISNSMSSMGARFVATALQASVMSAGMASSVQGVMSFVGALAPAVGIVAALPGALALGGAAFATLKVALSGVGDAFGAAMSGDYDKFMAGIKGLSGEAGEVAYELFQMGGAFQGLKLNVQGAFFAPLVGQMWSLLPAINAVEDGMVGTSGQFGRLAGDIVKFGGSAAGVNLINDVFRTLTGIVSDFESGTMQRLLGAIARFVSATLPAFSGLGGSLNTLVQRFTVWLDAATEAGKPLIWIQNALEGN